MGAVMKYVLMALRYAVQIGPLIYEGSVWAVKIIKEWRKKKDTAEPIVEPPVEPIVEPPVEPPVDAKPDPG